MSIVSMNSWPMSYAAEEEQFHHMMVRATQLGWCDVVTQYISDGTFNVQLPAAGSMTLLHTAARCGQAAVMEILLQHGAPVDATYSGSFTPLHFAAEKSHVRCAALLLEHRADIHATTSAGNMPLHYAACKNSDTKLCELLLERRADIDAPNGSGATALAMAVAVGQPNTVALLLEYGSDRTLLDRDGKMAHEGTENASLRLMVRSFWWSWTPARHPKARQWIQQLVLWLMLLRTVPTSPLHLMPIELMFLLFGAIDSYSNSSKALLTP